MKTMHLVAVLAASTFGLSAPLVFAGDRHEHGHEKHEGHDRGKEETANHGALHGGQYFEDDQHHGVEMVVTGNAIVFHVTEHHDPLDLTGSNFTAVLQTEAGTTMLPLSIERSTIKADLGSPLPKGARIVLTGKDGNGDTIQARFVKQ
ncbi:MAG: hypothetical protein KJ622_10530 [Alphaproteobacteria bacterium]|nr:hypothetical protein [Alphaproteobacteria bacterium]